MPACSSRMSAKPAGRSGGGDCRISTLPASRWTEIISSILFWLGGRDSNPDTQIQNLQSYRWTTSQRGGNRIQRGVDAGASCIILQRAILQPALFYNLRPMIA